MVDKIEKIVEGQVIKQAALYNRNGGQYYECFLPGETMNPLWFKTLDEVATFLREAPRRRIRMEPGKSITANNIYIDRVAL